MLEENNIKVFQLSVDKSFFGMSTIIKDKIAVVVLNNNQEIPIVRLRFTALHELAHLYLDLSAFDKDDKECEKMCDLFAGALLLPAMKIKQYLGAKRGQVFMKEWQMIAAQYGISLAATMYRAFTVDIITPSYFKLCMINYNKFNTREKEQTVYTHAENPDRFLQLLIRAVAEEVISTTKAASLNRQKLGDFREILDSAAQ
jgi:Zn-dependent peptidase ImmA (M78 family)